MADVEAAVAEATAPEAQDEAPNGASPPAEPKDKPAAPGRAKRERKQTAFFQPVEPSGATDKVEIKEVRVHLSRRSRRAYKRGIAARDRRPARGAR